MWLIVHVSKRGPRSLAWTDLFIICHLSSNISKVIPGMALFVYRLPTATRWIAIENPQLLGKSRIMPGFVWFPWTGSEPKVKRSWSIRKLVCILQTTCWKELSWITSHWRHDERDCFSNHQLHDCLLNSLFRRRSRKHQSFASLAFLISPVAVEFPAQMASNAENVSIWRSYLGNLYFGCKIIV